MRARSRGITLIELLMGIALTAYIILANIPSLTIYSQNVKIRAVADELQAALQQAKTEAIRRNSLVNLVLNNTGWSIVVVGQNHSTDTVVATRSSRTNEASITVNASANTLSFNGQGNVSPMGTYVIQISSPTSGTCQSAGGKLRCLQINVSAAGSIKVCDPALPSSDPRACNG